MSTEFEIIRRYFARPARTALLGVGDDCALVRTRAGTTLAVSTDMMIAGTHFFADAEADTLGHKALAVNLSDLAAMGAHPRWALLALALPRANGKWIAAFARGFLRLARRFGAELIGGDTTRGPLAICVTVIGEVPRQLALRRDAARAGDDIWVSGATGEAALGLAHLEGRVGLEGKARQACLERLHAPEPRVALGLRLRGLAHSAIDVSDGLLADLGHIARASGVAAELRWEDIPRAPAIASCGNAALAKRCVLAGGDDYELVFTAPASLRSRIVAAGKKARVLVTAIGTVVAGKPAVRVRDARGKPVTTSRAGFDHFA
ncbi:MAG TPA: thiamine-phosphate kinase [Burkholderiales bacterium]|nr:thiamine-phosphate kinase [Burkholderiales bacterium]